MDPFESMMVAKPRRATATQSSSRAGLVVALPPPSLDLPAPLDRDPFWRAARDGVERDTVVLPEVWSAADGALAAGGHDLSGDALARTWEDFAAGRVTLAGEGGDGDRAKIIAQVRYTARALAPLQASIALRVLRGDQQKFIAGELEVSSSTVSSNFASARIKLGLVRRAVPLPLVLAALTHAGIARIPRARRALFEQRDDFWLVVSVPRPAMDTLVALSEAEREVGGALIEGRSRTEIARLRSTSHHTVASQCGAIFCTLGATGRYLLIRRAAELQCFR